MDYPFLYDAKAGLTTLRDPMIIVYHDMYYLTGTQAPYWEGPNEGVRLWRSRDLKNWENLGLILKRADLKEDFWGIDRFWAPELFVSPGGKVFLTFGSRNSSEKYPHEHGVGLAVAEKPEGPYTLITTDEPISRPGLLGNDATLFTDGDGTVYLGYTAEKEPGDPPDGCNKLTLSVFDENTYRLSDTRTVCYCGKEGEWDHIGIEGQCIVRRNGQLYMWYSSWTRGYEAGILNAKTMRGEWVKNPGNPVLSEGKTWHRAGHNHSFRALDGRDYISFHAELKDPSAGPDDGYAERVFIRPVEYLPDGGVKILED